jgi:hypothetical protein
VWKKAGVTFDVLLRVFHGRNEENDKKKLGSTGHYLKVGIPGKKT